MKKVIFLFTFTFLSVVAVQTQAQVTIGSENPPHTDALLDLKEASDGSSTRGLLLPRVELASTDQAHPLDNHIAGMFVFNKANAGSGIKAVSPGTYYNTGEKWVRVNSPLHNWFYMPSTPINTEVITAVGDPDIELKMYDVFISQFLNIPAGQNSTGSAASIVSVSPAATDFDYFITGYDSSVFQITGVTSDGILKYRVIGNATDETYINIVFVLK